MLIHPADYLLAGPYELISKTNPKEKLSLCITGKYEISSRKYNNGNPLSTMILARAKDFDGAMGDLEALIESYKKDYISKDDMKTPEKPKSKPLIGKRPASQPKAGAASSVAVKALAAKILKTGPDTSVSVEKSGQSKPEEEKKEGAVRRSGRNIGKEAEYNLDKLYKMQDEMEGLQGAMGKGKCIQVMLA